MLRTGTLHHGGIMVNYRCTAACRHCLYACSPSRESGYVTSQEAREICRLLLKGGCGSVHIGGGEPFLDFEGLLGMLRELGKNGVAVEYVETNGFWALPAGPEAEEAPAKLGRLLDAGVNTLCISLDPYHAEYVPYGAPLALAALCEKAGMGFFLWKGEFVPRLSRLEPRGTYSRPEMEQSLSKTYIRDTAELYGISYGGRAVNIETEYRDHHPLESLLDPAPCRRLLSTGHFHVDRHGFFIPPFCTGLRIPLAEAVAGIPPGKYPVFEALYHGGVSALAVLAREQGFRPRPAYPSKCNLCFHIRRFLSARNYMELYGEHYEESLKYY